VCDRGIIGHGVANQKCGGTSGENSTILLTETYTHLNVYIKLLLGNEDCKGHLEVW